MMRSWLWCALALVAAQSGLAQQQAPAAAEGVRAAAAGSEEPGSIFNGQIRRYSFALEGLPVTTDTAEEFVVRYQGRDKERPRIFGAYADDEHNALVVVAAPEAEQAIRESLAEWLIDRGGIESPSLRAQRRVIESRWRTIVSAMAEAEVALVEATGDRAQQIRERMRLYEGELTTLEKQLQVMDRYIARLAAGPTNGSKPPASPPDPPAGRAQ